MNSKPLKSFDEIKIPWWQDNKVYDYLSSLWWKIAGRTIDRISHILGWAPTLWHDYDWEAHSIISILEYKLLKVRKALQNGNAIQEDVHMKAIDVALRLAARLKDDDYYRAYNRHERKWGELKHWTEPTENKHSLRWCSTRAKIKTGADEEQERIEFLEAVQTDERTKVRERTWFFNIIAKYMPYWWD